MRSRLVLAALAVLGAAGLAAQPGPAFDEHLLEALTFRNLGPFRMGARISDVAVPAYPERDHRYTFYVATWSGGLWKTTDNGTTFTPIFDGVGSPAIGDVALAPTAPAIVWVGTGDAFTSRSSLAGDGVYRSTDGGRTWTHRGLAATQHVARIVIDPRDPDVVYVAAMGRLYSENEDRGVFKTTDGGDSWQKVLYVDERTGVIDLVIDPRRPDVLYAATYEKQRLPWQLVNGGPGSGIYRTADAGGTWEKLEGGLPSGRVGRIGLDIYPPDPDIVYAVVENANPRSPTSDPSARAEMIGGEVYRTDDGGRRWVKMNADTDNVSRKGPYYFSQIRVDPNDDQRLFVTGETLGSSTDGGRTWRDITWPPRTLFSGIFGDVRTLWIDPADSERLLLGSDGGVYMSYDGGRTSDHYANLPLGEVYFVGADMEDPYNIYAGLQDHENWRGPSRTPTGEITSRDWVAVGDGDGMATVPDPVDSRWLYTTRHYGGHARVDQQGGYRIRLAPEAPPGQPEYRFQWETPVTVSPHDSRVVFTGAQVLLRSEDRGDHWTAISPDLSTNPADRILPSSEGGLPGGIPWFAISSIAESPITAGLLWVGTSDGRVHLTRDGGDTWTDMTARLTALGGREDAYVSRVVASAHVEGRAYVSKSGYKFDDFRPFLFRTDDYGATWTSMAANLPDQPINVVYEDRTNADLLFVGNDRGLWVSIDRGARWVRMNNNIPDVAIRDLLVHPRDNDLIVGSYGRGLWVTDVSVLQEMTASVLAEDVHLFAVEPTSQYITWAFGANDYLFGQRHLQTPNPPNGMVIRYYLKTGRNGPATVVIADAEGREVGRVRGTTEAGLNAVTWNMRAGGGRGRGSSGSGGSPLDQLVPPGLYQVRLEVGDAQLTRPARITVTIGWPLGVTPRVIR